MKEELDNDGQVYCCLQIQTKMEWYFAPTKGSAFPALSTVVLYTHSF